MKRFPIVIMLVTLQLIVLAKPGHTLQSKPSQEELIKKTGQRKIPLSSKQKPTPRKVSFLLRVEYYKAPPPPMMKFAYKETYDNRLDHDDPIPPTLVDTFIADLYERMVMDLKISSKRRCNISQDKIIRSLSVYMDRNWSQIGGYRPWTHWNFIRSLNEAERKILSGEILEYMLREGIKDPDSGLSSCKLSERK